MKHSVFLMGGFCVTFDATELHTQAMELIDRWRTAMELEKLCQTLLTGFRPRHDLWLDPRWILCMTAGGWVSPLTDRRAPQKPSLASALGELRPGGQCATGCGTTAPTGGVRVKDVSPPLRTGG